MRTDELDFVLPDALIAQTPARERTDSRLLHYRRSDQSIAHRVFSDLPSLLRPDDLLVFNDARVLPARFALQKITGGRIDALFLDEPGPGRWHVMLRGLGRNVARPLRFVNDTALVATVASIGPAGEYEIELSSREPAEEILRRVGRMPLPPYIRREKDRDERDEEDRSRYQTVFAAQAGAVAAPTAALHFSQPLLDAIDAAGIERTFVTLRVGLGTFKPVTAATLEEHVMHRESYTIGADAAACLNRDAMRARRIVAVGTTSARVLESQPPGVVAAGDCSTDLLIYPPYRWKRVGALLTNFHLPRSTLIALVAALVGLDKQRELYQIAIEAGYRFFSYGDAMFIE